MGHVAEAHGLHVGRADPAAGGPYELCPTYPEPPALLLFDRPLDTHALLAPEAAWAKKMAGVSYSPSKPATGMAAMKALDEWLSSGLDPEGYD